MRGKLGTLAAIALATLAVAPPAHGEEQTRESYKAQVEPICMANRKTNEKIMTGAQKRINKNELGTVGKQFIRLSESFGKLVKRLARVPAPVTDEHRVDRWLEILSKLQPQLRQAGRTFIAGNKIKGNHEAIRAERIGLSANNTTIPLHFHYCHFGHNG